MGLPHAEEPGVTKWHHASCVLERLRNAPKACMRHDLANCWECPSDPGEWLAARDLRVATAVRAGIADTIHSGTPWGAKPGLHEWVKGLDLAALVKGLKP